uniref:UDP-galactose transporter n=1 Tax=Thelazia callipaeda TaxID=103827 RepID=A0A158RC74_THECL
LIREHADYSTNILRLSTLVWLTVQNSIHVILLRYSRARHVEKVFLSSVAVFLTEIFKLIICMVLITKKEQSLRRLIELFYITIIVLDNPKDTIKVCIPAVIYTIQNNLFYLAASHLEAATFMVTAQFKIFTTAIFTVFLLKRAITKKQWLALGVLFVGVCLVQLKQYDEKQVKSEIPFLGFIAAAVACILSGFAGIYFEKILKSNAPISIWMRNVQMGVFGVPSSLIASILKVIKYGFFYGFDMLVWIVVLWYCIGGLSVAVCIKYADNIAKNFATSVAIIINTVASIYIFDFTPNLPFLVGAVMVIISIFLYSSSKSVG